MVTVSQYEANGHMVLHMVHTNRARAPAAEHVAADVGLFVMYTQPFNSVAEPFHH